MRRPRPTNLHVAGRSAGRQSDPAKKTRGLIRRGTETPPYSNGLISDLALATKDAKSTGTSVQDLFEFYVFFVAGKTFVRPPSSVSPRETLLCALCALCVVKKMKPFVLFLLAVTAVLHADDSLPHLARQGSATQLIVDSQPFIIRGGELGNSSAEPDYLRPFWPKLKAMHLNTVVAPVYWDVIEPAEGAFDFRTVDGLLADARAADMHLVLLWFGSWKNSMSCYVPPWIKRDPARFPRCRDSAGRALEILAPTSAVNRDTDARAFAALMRHLREADGARHTVLLVQVENEIGMIPEERDHSPEAEAAFRQPVPAELMEVLDRMGDAVTPALRDLWAAAGRKHTGTWTEVFGPGPAAGEIFAAWSFARYVDVVTRAGKAEYPLPMYVNAALMRPGHMPGQYPSGGPLPHLFDVWRAGAPSIDILSPDIYFTNFAEWARRYAREGNPLFIPEAVRSGQAPANALYVVGGLNAIGFSPFAIESTTDAAARLLGESYDLIAQLTPLIVAHRGETAGLLPEGPEQRQPQEVHLGGYRILVSFEAMMGPAWADQGSARGDRGSPEPQPTGGLVIATGPDEFLFAGSGITATFDRRSLGEETVGIVSVETGRFEGGKWVHERWLNGDETNQGRQVSLPPGHFGIQTVRLYRYR